MLDRPDQRVLRDLRKTETGQSVRRRVLAFGLAALLLFSAGIAFGNYASDAQLLTQVRVAIAKAIARGQRESATLEVWRGVATHLHDIETVTIALPPSQGAGGGLAAIGSSILYVQPWGDFGYIDAAGTTHGIDVKAPMNQDGMLARTAQAKNFDRKYFRVTDILAEPIGPDRVRVFVGHHRYVDNCVELWLSSIDLVAKNGAIAAAPDSGWHTIFRAQPCVPFRSPDFYTFFEGHFSGGRIVRLDGQRLLFSVGEFGWDGTEGTPKTSHDPNTDLGKIIAINPSTGRSEHFAIGLRNGQGLTIDHAGRIWETEHGPKGGDELNLIRAGGDYGWPVSTLGVQYGGRPWPFNPEQGRHTTGIAPVFAWVPSIGVSNLIEAPTAQFPRWRGDLLVGSLVDNGLWRLRLDGDHVVYSERISFDGERLRDIIALPDGRIAIMTDSQKVILIRRALKERTLAQTDDPEPTGRTALPPARTRDGARGRVAFQSACASCHGLDGKAGVGPSLLGVIGRKVGGGDFPYSAALASETAAWDRARLKAFLNDPRAMYPGTLMSRAQLEPSEIDALIAYIEEVR